MSRRNRFPFFLCEHEQSCSLILQAELHQVQHLTADWLAPGSVPERQHSAERNDTSSGSLFYIEVQFLWRHAASCPTLTPPSSSWTTCRGEESLMWRPGAFFFFGNSVPTEPAVTVSRQLLSNKQIHLPIRKYHIIPRDSPLVNCSRPSSCIWCSIS